MKQPRPSEAIFADGRNARPLALHPEAIGVSYPTREVRDRNTYELRAMVASDVAEIVGGVAVLSIDGPLEHKSDGGWWSYWQTYEDLARDFKLVVEDASVSSIVLKFDSPGGDVSGLNETVAIMQGMKRESGKTVIAYVDEACYSAAYALAMVADEIYLPESGGVGSIGVITAMADVTEMNKKDGIRVEVIASGTKKTDGHPCVALTDGAISRTRKVVDKLAASFFDIVAAGRGMPAKTIASYQAGTFTGHAAVDAGLADGIMSLQDCLTLLSDPSSQSKSTIPVGTDKEIPMSGVLAAQKALNDANKAMAAAKTDADRALCAARVLAAEDVAAKVKKTKTVTTDTHEEEIDDGEPEDDEDDAEKAELPKDDGDEDAEKASALLPSKRDVVALARRITGKKSIDEVMGALQGMADSHKRTSKLAAEVAQLKADAEASKVSALVSQGLKAGKIAPSQKAWAKTLSPAGLKAYLDAAPKMIHTSEDEHTEARVEGAGIGSVTAEMAKIWKKQGFTEADFPKLVEKLNGAKRMNGAS